MNKQNALGIGRDGLLNSFSCQAEIVIDLSEHRQTTAQKHAFDRCDVGKGRNDDLIAKTQTRGSHNRSHRRGSAAHSVGMRSPRERADR